ncbi:MAG: hypothetical protein ABSC55_11715 [Syntrophorhabdales bacterium]|jgi:hypothetical protein
MINCGNLKDLIYDFVFKFSRFEFALKEFKYRKPGKFDNNAEPDWTGFVRDFEGVYSPCQFARKLLEKPPRRQIIKDGNLDWENLCFHKTNSWLKKVVLSIKTIRNNLFHGGKHGDKSWDDQVRITFLLENANRVIDQLSNLDPDLHEYYR